MSRSVLGSRRRPLITTTLLLGLTACGAPLQIDRYPTAPNTDVDCRTLLADAPSTVADQPNREVGRTIAAAWGDPAIVLRCGVEPPSELTAGSRCDEVAGIGWFSEEITDGYVFTTIGRQFSVSVEVPSDYEPATDALVDLAPVIERHVPVVDPCV